MPNRAGVRVAAHDPISPGPATPEPRVLFIGGLGRSGSTLLERLLGQVEGVQTLGETVHLWVRGIERNELCGCGCSFRDCPFWNRVGQVAFDGWSNVDVGNVTAMRNRVDRMRHVPKVLARPGGEVQQYAQLFHSLYDAARQVSGARLIVDSSKHPSLAYCLRTQKCLDLRVVHIVRDPRAVAYSWAKTVERPEGGLDEPYMNRYSPARAASLWTGENAAITTLGHLGVPVIRIRYEALVANPEGQLRRVLDFVDMPADASLPVEGRHATLQLNHTVSGNPLRFHSGALEIRPDDEWLTGLGDHDRKVVSAITAVLRAAYRIGSSSDARRGGHDGE